MIELPERQQNTIIDSLDFEKNKGLIPAIIQDSETKEVLMLGYMTKEALRKTFKTNKIHFWSRTRNKLWMKGESSGNIGLVEGFAIDCDQDTLLFKITRTGPICHTGERSCFSFQEEAELPITSTIFERIFEIINERKKTMPENSYVAKMITKGEESMLRKIGEEAIELILAGKEGKDQEIIHEAADVFFHVLLFLAEKQIALERVYRELALRHEKKTHNDIEGKEIRKE